MRRAIAWRQTASWVPPGGASAAAGAAEDPDLSGVSGPYGGLSLALALEGAPRKKRVRKHQPHWKRTEHLYFVCTYEGCGWSGTKRFRHRHVRPSCPCVYPCPIALVIGEQVDYQKLARDYVARCTPRQRELGLPPDGEKPVPRVIGADGNVCHTPLFLTIPVGIGLSEGKQFTVPMGPGRGRPTVITVPAGCGEGDVLSIEADKFGRPTGALPNPPSGALSGDAALANAAPAVAEASAADDGDEGGGEPGQPSAPMDVDDDVDVDDGGDAADDEL